MKDIRLKNMRLNLIAIIPLILGIVALGAGFYATGTVSYMIIGVAAATVLVSAAILFSYTKRTSEAKQVPIENFSLWVDVGEPADQLKNLNLIDSATAVRITSTDLASLGANAELLGNRISMLTGKPGFEGLLEEKLSKRGENLANDINAITTLMNSSNELYEDFITKIEQCAAQADRLANKLFEFEGGKPYTIYIYVDPLRRAAEKLSRDLRLTSANISKFMRASHIVSQPTEQVARSQKVLQGLPQIETQTPAQETQVMETQIQPETKQTETQY